MRILIVDTYYPAFLASHYESRPGLAAAPYETQVQSLFDRCFGTSDAYSRAFREQGHWAAEVIPNCDSLQLRWAEEHGAARWSRRLARIPRAGRAARSAMQATILRAQIGEHDPDVLYFQDLDALRLIDSSAREGRLIVGQIASPAPPDDRLRRLDLLFSSFPHFVDRFRALGVDSEYLQIGFDPKVREKLAEAGENSEPGGPRPVDVAFVGGIDPGVHRRGTRFLEELSERVALEVWGYGAASLPPDSPLRRRYRGEAWGLDMYSVLARSKIALNRHIDAAEGRSNNMRLFEATGVGAVLATEASPNLADFFAPGREAIAYGDIDELAREVEALLGDDVRRLEIANAGQERTLADHTYSTVVGRAAAAIEARLANA